MRPWCATGTWRVGAGSTPFSRLAMVVETSVALWELLRGATVGTGPYSVPGYVVEAPARSRGTALTGRITAGSALLSGVGVFGQRLTALLAQLRRCLGRALCALHADAALGPDVPLPELWPSDVLLADAAERHLAQSCPWLRTVEAPNFSALLDPRLADDFVHCELGNGQLGNFLFGALGRLRTALCAVSFCVGSALWTVVHLHKNFFATPRTRLLPCGVLWLHVVSVPTLKTYTIHAFPDP